MAANRSLLKSFVIRDLKSRYVGSVGGFLWAVVQPVVLLVSYSFVFSTVLKIRMGPELGSVPFPIYLFCGILPWLTFQDTLLRSCTVIADNANLIKKTTISAELLPVAIAVSNLFHHAVGLAVILVILGFGYQVTVSAAGVLLYLAPMVFLSIGLAWIVSSLHVFFRDTAQVVSILLTFWFWFTPILYTLETIPERFRWIAALNPLSHVVTGYRGYLLSTSVPSLQVLLVFAGTSLVICIGGRLFFRAMRPAFADVL